jgi:di/tricarboxylate transporter
VLRHATLIAGLMLLGMALGFVMPSSLGRAAVLVPVGMALADSLGLQKGSLGRTGVAVIVTIGTNIPSFTILPSSSPNIILSGVAEQALGVQFSYAGYLLLHYPILGMVKSGFIVGFVLHFFPAHLADAAKPAKLAPATNQQLALLALLLTVPQLGFVPPPVFKSSVDFSMILFVAGALTLGTVVNTSGLGDLLAHVVFKLLPFQPDSDFLNFVSLSLLGIGTWFLQHRRACPQS